MNSTYKSRTVICDVNKEHVFALRYQTPRTTTSWYIRGRTKWLQLVVPHN